MLYFVFISFFIALICLFFLPKSMSFVFGLGTGCRRHVIISKIFQLLYLPCYDIWLNVLLLACSTMYLLKPLNMFTVWFMSVFSQYRDGVIVTVCSVTWLVHIGQPTLLRLSSPLSCKITRWRSLNWNVIIKMYSWSQVRWRACRSFFFFFRALWITFNSTDLARPGWHDNTNPITLITNVF